MMTKRQRDDLRESLYNADPNAMGVLQNEAYRRIREAIRQAAPYVADAGALKSLVLDAYGVVAAEMNNAG